MHCAVSGALAAPYMVSFDVSRAYDSVDVAQLLLLVEPLLQQPHYLMVKYSEVRPASPRDHLSQLRWGSRSLLVPQIRHSANFSASGLRHPPD